MKIRYKYSLISDVGNLRKNNEDNFFVFGEENRNPKNNIYSCNGEFVNEKAFFCVCDGMGGHSAGGGSCIIYSNSSSAKKIITQ